MHDRFRLECREGRLNPVAIGQIAFDKLRPGINCATVSLGQVVEYADGMALVEQQFGADAADVACSADNENFHRGSCGAPARCVKTNRRADRSLTLVCLDPRDHAPDEPILPAGRQDLETLLLRSPFQNIDVDPPDPPRAHGPAAGLVEVDRVGANQRAAIIVDDVALLRADDLEPRPERETRPVGGRADVARPEKVFPIALRRPPLLGVGVGRRPDVRDTLSVRRLGVCSRPAALVSRSSATQANNAARPANFR